jgi:hypothetical protein
MRNIQELFEQAGLSIQEAEFVVRRPEVTELTDHWMRLPSELRRLLLSRPFGNVYQVVVKAAPRSRVGPGLSLLSQPVERSGGPLPDHIAAIGARLVRRFAPGARRRIYRLVNRLGLWR